MALPKGPVYQQLGARIRELRTAISMTQAELAHATSLTRTSITNIEKGRQPVQVHVLLLIADALGVKTTDLLSPFDRVLGDSRITMPRGLDASVSDWVKRVLREDANGG